MEMNVPNMKFYRVKGTKSPILKFQEQFHDINHRNIQGLAEIIKSAKGKQTLDLNFPK